MTQIDLKQWIQVVEDTGPVIAYHGSLGPITGRFHAHTHFGTLKAAIQRITEASDADFNKVPGMADTGQPMIYKVQLIMHKPVQIEDGWQDAADEADGLLALGHIDEAEAKAIRAGRIDAVKLLMHKGFDGLTYINQWEDAGSLSYVPFTAEQINIIEAKRYLPHV